MPSDMPMASVVSRDVHDGHLGPRIDHWPRIDHRGATFLLTPPVTPPKGSTLEATAMPPATGLQRLDTGRGVPPVAEPFDR